MDFNKTDIKDETINKCPDVMSILKPLIDNGELARTEDGWKWTEKSLKKAIRNAKHIHRYFNYGWYRLGTKIYRGLTNFFIFFR